MALLSKITDIFKPQQQNAPEKSAEKAKKSEVTRMVAYKSPEKTGTFNKELFDAHVSEMNAKRKAAGFTPAAGSAGSSKKENFKEQQIEKMTPVMTPEKKKKLAENDLEKHNETPIDWTDANQRKEFESKRGELQTKVDTAGAEIAKKKENDVFREDYDAYHNWSEEDRAAMDDYIKYRDESNSNRDNLIMSTISAVKQDRAYKKLSEKYDAETIKNIAETVSRAKHQEQANEVKAEAAKDASDGIAKGIGSNLIGSVARNVGGVSGTLGRIPELFERTGRYDTLEEYRPTDLASLYGNTVESQTAKNIAGDGDSKLRNAAAIGYRGAMSFLDNTSRALLLGKGSLALAGMNAFSSSVSEASARGADKNQALLYGVADAALETATEMIPLDNMLGMMKGGVDSAYPVIAGALKQIVPEVSSEEINYFCGLLLEAAMLQDKSEYRQTINDLVNSGKTYDEAKQIANMQVWEQAKDTAIVTAVSSGLSGGYAGYVGSKNTDNTQSGETQNTELAQNEQVQNAVQQEAAPVNEQAAPSDFPQNEQVNFGKADIPENTAPSVSSAQYKPAYQANQIEARPEGSTVAAPADFTGKPNYNAALSETNAQADRASDVRPMELPKTDINGNPVSAVTGNAYGSRITTDELASLMEEPAARGAFSYARISNNEATQRAADTIGAAGDWATAYTNWTKEVERGVAGAEMSARGALLLNHAAQTGDKQLYLNTLQSLSSLGTNTAQGLQALRIIRNLNAPDKIEFARMSVQKMVADMKLDTNIELDQNLIDRYENAKTDMERDAIMGDIMQNVADQIPSSFIEKFNALRHMNMLGNLKTNVRNVAGNVGSWATYRAKDAVGALIEKAAGTFDSKLDRTKSLFAPKAYRDFAADDFYRTAGIQAAVGSGTKYSDGGNSGDFFRDGVQDRRTIFKSNANNPAVRGVMDNLMKPLEGYRRITNDAMNNGVFGDEAFGRAAYSRALAGYMKANGITPQQFAQMDANGNEFCNKARAYAVKEAQEATFHDNTALANVLSKTKNSLGVVGEGIMPYTKTPANVLVRAEEFSPLGIINTAITAAKATKGGGDVTGTDVINSLSKTLTGDMIFALGAAMFSQGLVVGGADEDDKKAAFDKMNGIQSYAIRLPNGDTYTMDWLSPVAMPFFMGAEFMKLVGENNEDLTFADLERVFTSIGDPLMQMSMMSGVNDSLNNIKYSSNNLAQFVINAGVGYLTQGLTNQFIGQIERSTEENRMSTYVDKDSWMPQWMQRQIGSASQKIPGWDFQQTEYRNAWGEKQENVGGSFKDRLAYNTLSPGFYAKNQEDETSRELNRLHDATGSSAMYPQTMERTISYTDKHGQLHKGYNLSAEEYERIQTEEGQTAKRIIDSLVKDNSYQAMPDSLKESAIADAYEFAREQAKQKTIDGYYSGTDGNTVGWIEAAKKDPAKEIIKRTVINSLASDIGNIKERSAKGWDIPEAAGQGIEEAWNTFDTLSYPDQQAILKEATGDTARALAAKAAKISAGDTAELFEDIAGLRPEDGKKNVADNQRMKVVADDWNLSEKQKIEMVNSYLTENQVMKFTYCRGKGLDTKAFVDIKQYCDKEKPDGKKSHSKQDIIKYLRTEYGLSSGEATKIYKTFRSSTFKEWKQNG